MPDAYPKLLDAADKIARLAPALAAADEVGADCDNLRALLLKTCNDANTYAGVLIGVDVPASTPAPE
jgi:hypothetical protein